MQLVSCPCPYHIVINKATQLRATRGFFWRGWSNPVCVSIRFNSDTTTSTSRPARPQPTADSPPRSIHTPTGCHQAVQRTDDRVRYIGPRPSTNQTMAPRLLLCCCLVAAACALLLASSATAFVLPAPAASGRAATIMMAVRICELYI